MPIVKRECIEQIKERADLYDIVSGYVQLKRSGSNWKGLSPFTVEKTPSFFVLPEKKFFKCFSTGYAGDVFRFLELKEHFSFIEAVEWLAKRYGIPLVYERQQRTEYSKNELFDIHEIALQYYRKQFLTIPDVQSYWIKERQFSLEAAERYGIGWAPVYDHELLRLLQQKHFTQEALKQCGLFYVNEHNEQDLRCRFSGRLMIPIYDVQDRIIGFSGRILKAKEGIAKYVNSPETPIFHKGNILYGLNHARRFVGDHFILVEGQLDTLRCWENGLHVAVAPQGTGITEAQIQLLRRYTSKVICLTDGDAAGQKCALRVVELSLKAGIDCQIITLPEGADPDALLRDNGKLGFGRLQKESLIPYVIRILLPKNMESTAVEKESFLKTFYGLLQASDSEVTQNLYLEELAKTLELDPIAVRNDFRNFCGDRKFDTKALTATQTIKEKQLLQKEEGSSSKLRSAEYDLLSLILHHESIGEKVNEFLDERWIPQTKQGQLLLKVLNEIREGMWSGPQSESFVFSEDEVNELFSILATDEEVEEPVAAANTCVKALCNGYAKQQLEKINQKEAEQIKFTKNKNQLDDLDFLKNLQAEKLRLRRLLFSCPKIEA